MFGFRGGFLGGFFGGFFSGIFLGKIRRKNPPKNPRFSRKLFDQNPLREISALTFGVSFEQAVGLSKTAPYDQNWRTAATKDYNSI